MILQIDLGPYEVLIRETAIIVAIQIIYVLSLNLEAGYLGLPQFGKVMFLALGAFAAGGIATKIALKAYEQAMLARFGTDPLANVDAYCSAYQYLVVGEINKIFATSPLEGVAFFLLSLVLAALIGGAFGIVMAGPALRLREDYLGILLLVSAETIRVVTTYTPQLACGVFGAALPDPFAWMGDVRPWGYLAVVGLFALAAFFVVERLGNSPFGRALKAIRDAETAAVVFGKDIVRFRMRVLAVASAMAAVAGALSAFYNNYIIMNQFTPLLTFVAWAMLIIGGIGNNIGAVVGVSIYYIVDRALSIYKDAIRAVVKVDPVYFQYMAFGVIIIVILLFLPQGLVAERPVRTLGRRVLKKLKEEA